ncbi:MAG TPA: hypothetical protein VHG70_01720 [Nocardioidaceae bacterium]|nr:hypothetical protein [Nocardioidaceae bacterium]
MDPSRSDTVTIARRFCGPPGCGNGGYTAGSLATVLLHDRDASAVDVMLRRPPPLDTAMEVRRTGDTAALSHDGHVVAEARAAELTSGPVDGVSLAEAREAESAYPGLVRHPFPTCFTCGPQREPGDALRLSPGRIAGARTACTWTPDAWLASAAEPSYVRREFVWASLDCPGGWTTDIEGRPMVLGRITAEIDAPAEVGERHVIMGRLLREDGRKAFTATTLYDSDGRVVARAEHVWITVDPAAFS